MVLSNNNRLFSTHSAKNSQAIQHNRNKEHAASFDLNQVQVNNPANRFLDPYKNSGMTK